MTVRFSPCGEWVGGIRTDVVLFKYSKYYCWRATTAMSAGGSVGTWLEARSINNRFVENGHGKRRSRCGHSATTCPRRERLPLHPPCLEMLLTVRGHTLNFLQHGLLIVSCSVCRTYSVLSTHVFRVLLVLRHGLLGGTELDWRSVVKPQGTHMKFEMRCS